METASVTQTAASGGLISVGDNTLGQDDFLQLLVTQLQSQDPLNPQDSTEFTAQLAQFSSLEQLFNINAAIDTLTTFEAAVANTQAAGFIGRLVSAYGDSVSVQDGEVSGAQFTLGEDADDVSVTIRDESGSVVRVIDLGALDSGTHEIDWDGLTNSGEPAADGHYTVSVSATADDVDIAAELFVEGLVEGVEFDVNGTFLVIGGRRVPLGDVVSVHAAPA